MIIFVIGIIMLVIKIIIVIGYEFDFYNDMILLIMVLGVFWLKNLVYIIGSILVGIYKI